MMYSNILLKTLRDGQRSTFFFSAGQLAIGLLLALLFPDVASSFAGMIEDLPEFFQAFIGSAAEFATPEGFLTADPYSAIALVIMFAFSINRGMGAIAAEERNHTLDQLLGNPISRTDVYLQKSLALIVDCVLPVAAVALGILIGALIMDYSVSISGLLQMSLSLLLISYATGFLALGIGAATGSKTLAMGIPAAVAVIGYLIHILVPLVDTLDDLKYISILHYYIGDKPFINGLTPWHSGVLLAIAAISFIFGLYRFNNRDLA